MAAKTGIFSKPAVQLADILAPERNSFGLIRLAAAISVLITHSFEFLSGTVESDPVFAWTGHALGDHGVQVFFFLSGILIAQSFEKSRSLLEFVTARALRIGPALAVCILLTAFVLGPLVSTLPLRDYLQDPRLARYIVSTSMLVTGSAPLPGVFDHLPLAGNVNLSLWTLKYEVACYIGLAALGFAGFFDRRVRFAAVGLLSFAIAALFIAPFKPADAYTVAENLRHFGLYFALGTLAYLVRERLALTWLAVLPLAAAAIGLHKTHFGELAAALLLGYLTLLLAARTWGRLGAFTREHDYSYGVYIYAAPVQHTLQYWMPGLDALVLSLWALAATLPLAYLSWTLIEKPALGMRRAWFGRRQAARVAPAPRSGQPAAVALAVPHAAIQSPVAFRWPARQAEAPPAPRTFAEGPLFANRLGRIAARPLES